MKYSYEILFNPINIYEKLEKKECTTSILVIEYPIVLLYV